MTRCFLLSGGEGNVTVMINVRWAEWEMELADGGVVLTDFFHRQERVFAVLIDGYK